MRFDFEDRAGAPASREYRDPLEVWTADSLADVVPLLRQCEQALASGLHVAGYLAYEAAPALDSALSVHPGSGSSLPLACFAAFRSAAPATGLAQDGFAVEPWQVDSDARTHARMVGAIREYIAAGDTYQVNHTLRLTSRLRGPASALYRELLGRQPAAYAAFFELAGHTLLSLSPELFFRRSGKSVIVRPMKGTIRRSRDPQRDGELAGQLLASAKDAAENVMITDLLRNDLGRLAVPGTVRVERLLQLQSLPTFHALTSTVSAHVPETAGLTELLTALFPCGSITGAPKARTMEIIAGLEQSPRGIYCGTLGFAEPGGEWVFNVAIRTLQHDRQNGSLTYGAGGGITWDSVAGSEYAEALLKASFLPGTPSGWRTGVPGQ